MSCVALRKVYLLPNAGFAILGKNCDQIDIDPNVPTDFDFPLPGSDSFILDVKVVKWMEINGVL